jgi:hypothetical protein
METSPARSAFTSGVALSGAVANSLIALGVFLAVLSGVWRLGPDRRGLGGRRRPSACHIETLCF